LSDTLAGNLALLRARFPELARLVSLGTDEEAAALAARVPTDWRVEPTPSGSPTLTVRGVPVHSRYNPLREAERALAEGSLASPDGMAFAGAGLAYLPELYAARNPNAPVAIVEPDLFLFLLCLSARDLSGLLSHERLTLVVGLAAPDANAVIEAAGLDSLPVHESPALAAPNAAWFAEWASIRKRNREKREINANTLRRFGGLWLRNMARNLGHMRDLAGIELIGNRFSGMPFVVLAAGPSLDRILPRLAELRERAVIVCVDTACRAASRAGVEPDFVVLVDPQYWNFRHLDGVSAPRSVLVTEAAAYPPVFRFPCRARLLAASLFPLGSYLEARTRPRGALGAGGSVSTSAWDLARVLGAGSIHMAGLDLGFPGRQTHFRGSVFEERTHADSTRLCPAETSGTAALYGAGPRPVPDYLGGTVLSDKRLILYAWWFESKLASHPEAPTFTLTPEGTRIPGFRVAAIEELLALPRIRPEIDRALDALAAEADRWTAPGPEKDARDHAFASALAELERDLAALKTLASRGARRCADERAGRTARKMDPAAFARELAEIDRAILANGAKEVSAMVFAAEPEAEADPLAASLATYRAIAEAADQNLRALKKD